MSKLIAISIDVTKLDKSRFVAGKKGTYANLTVSLNDEADQYGNNCSVWQSQTQEEREAKQDRNFLGNGKVVFDGDSKAPQQSRPAVKQEVFDDGLPF